jgi:hypothetical protein
MNSHDAAIVVYSLFALAGIALELLSRSGHGDIPSLGTVLSRVMHSRSGRIGVMAGWMWIGLHYFAR